MSHSLYYQTPVGWIRLAENKSATAITHLLYVKEPVEEKASFAAGSADGPPSPLLRQALEELQEYFAGTRRAFTLPLEPAGTAFEQTVWSALRTIPYGETRSYRQIAQQIGRPAACRAVGRANGRNPISLFIPCHRVIGADGRLTGYAGGLDAKQRLLELERGGSV